MLVKQSFRVHQSIPHVAKKEKKAIFSQSPEIDSLNIFMSTIKKKTSSG